MSSKSWALMIESSGGFAFSGSSGFSVDDGCDHSFVIVCVSSLPLSFEGSRFFGRIDGACIEAYEAVASRPAWFQMTIHG